MKSYQILDVEQINKISRWAFSKDVEFSYPVRHELLAIQLSPEQELEFLSLFGLYIQPAAGP